VIEIGLEWLEMTQNRTLENQKTQQWSFGNSYAGFVLITKLRHKNHKNIFTINLDFQLSDRSFYFLS
jgi:hypothetical protein